MKSTKKTRVTHSTPKRAARLETPKGKPTSESKAKGHKKIRKEFPLAESASLQTAYRDIAEKLALVLQHPATPNKHFWWLRQLAKFIVPLADVEIETINAPRTGVESVNPRDASFQLGMSIVSALENADMPVEVWNEMLEWSGHVEDLLRPEDTGKAEVTRFRGILRAYAEAARAESVRAEVDRINAEYSARMERQRAKNEAKIAWVKSPKIVEEKVIRNLVERFLPRDDDDATKAFITLIQLIVQNDDSRDRDSIAVWACDMAYQSGTAYSSAALKYFDEATEEFRSRVA